MASPSRHSTTIGTVPCSHAEQLPLNMVTSLERRDVGTKPCKSSPPSTLLLPSSQDQKPALGRNLPAPSRINGVPDMLCLPLELRWQIFHPFILADEHQLCAYAQTHLPFIIWDGGKREKAPITVFTSQFYYLIVRSTKNWYLCSTLKIWSIGTVLRLGPN